MASSQRIQRGSLTKGSKAVDILTESDKNLGSASRLVGPHVGAQLRNRDDFTSMLSCIKSNNSDAILVNGNPIGERFDDQISPNVSGEAGNLKEFKNLETPKSHRVTKAVSHTIEKRDLGQIDPYADNSPFFETTDPLSPLEIISTNPNDLFLPFSMVDYSSAVSMDGVIDPFDTRMKMDGTLLETPFSMRGVKAAFSDEDFLRRSLIINTGYNLDTPSVSPFLDYPEFMGPVELPSIFLEDEVKITPFADKDHHRESYFIRSRSAGIDIDPNIEAVLVSGSFDTSGAQKFDIQMPAGFDYSGNSLDSIAFGGLIK